MMLCHYILQGRKTAQNEAGKKKNFLRKSVVLGWKKALAFGTLYDKYVERKTPSLDKDTHTFASDATSAPVVLTLRFASGSPPRCGASSFPSKVLRPCWDPKRKSALTALSSLAYASMPASSSLSSSGFPPPKSPSEFLRGRNGIRGSAERQAGWRLSTRCAMSGGIYARKNCMCSCQTKVITEKHGGSCRGAD